MHELAITQEVVRLAAEHARGRVVRRVILEVGQLAAIVPDSVRFCFEALVPGTALEGASLEILESPGRARCRPCDVEQDLSSPWGTCASCGGADLEWVGGCDLRVKALELEVASV